MPSFLVLTATVLLSAPVQACVGAAEGARDWDANAKYHDLPVSDAPRLT
ncbi:hypothetical protein PtrV1_13230 [Pyrenophora tritici-repentis]|uniref:Uncharacterized protein n=1 Tax=Pyrenophora tritici-repentis TaxID=45151 RepID=A0A5M9KSW8_9PLEO|nr:hypothetical protein PtrV1_13230 [Pyrenophora tritici-repentis]KAF7569076.1 hypothetical protein PtrM4_114910 [Pyrenophora tritici-repentis]